MDFLNIGSGELVFIALLAILIVGPKRSVQLFQQGGRFMAYLRREWSQVQREILTEVRAVEQEASRGIQPALDEALKVVEEGEQAFRDTAIPPNPAHDKAE